MCQYMKAAVQKERGTHLASDISTARPASVGEVASTIGALFDEKGALGLMLVDVPALADIERRHGTEARSQVLGSLTALIRDVGRERLAEHDLVVSGEVGRSEVAVLFFRESRSAAFYRTEMPSFVQALYREMEQRGARTFYPYLRGTPTLQVGTSVMLRNPKFAVETQLRELLDDAREDGDLHRRTRQRKRRRKFTEMILDQKVFSVYEPIVDVHSRTVFGYEALARGPEGTELYSPGALFAAAEEYDLVYALDCLCRASGLEGAIEFPAGTKLFLNILPTSIHDPNFQTDRLIRTLERSRLSPSDVVFEISEQESIDNLAVFRELSDQYRRLGFQFALDDTGSGYAGLEELLELQPEFIKIDRSMVSGVDQDPARQNVLLALLSVAEKTGARVIGEGLDRLEELEMLGELGIHFGQGWLFGHPTPLRARVSDGGGS